MRKRTILTILVLWLALTVALAVPARPGVWQVLVLSDGTSVKAELKGDESFHYWQAADGTCYVSLSGGYVAVEDIPAWKSRSKTRQMRARGRQATQGKMPDFPVYQGKKRGLLILVEFSNKQFDANHDHAFYNNVANKVGFISKDGFSGSVHDYFLDQSNGMFDLTLDVVGPVRLSRRYQYYGENGDDGEDLRPGEMVAEACRLADPEVNFADYDWDGNGEVDMVLVLYAGRGEADGGEKNTIWPHEWQLYESDYGEVMVLDHTNINEYACFNEKSSAGVEGIGVICHEFSHCLGLPDMYDLYDNNFGMGRWSLMDSGSYNGDGFCPAGFTSFEKLSCGWIKPVVLDADTTITDMKPLSKGGEAYMLKNDGCPSEFYLIENRQNNGWDALLPGRGMLILHVDYDEKVWYFNEVNSTSKKQVLSGNDHQRCTIFHADNSISFTTTDTYPYNTNDQLTAISRPAAMLYNDNVDGTRFMGKAITGITQGRNGIMSFSVGPQQYEANAIVHHPSPVAGRPGAIYSLDGRYLGNDLQVLKPGFYIVDGRKVFK